KARIPFDVPEEHKFEIVRELKEELSEEYEETNTRDGIRIELENGWVLIRASNTSPVIRLTVEAETVEDFRELKEEFSEEISRKIEQMSD
ncbi:MAG: phosphoglucosamine mutase, partial [Candidatus Nanohaloarchaea archaeon]